jgi:DNA-binding transcriptional regulator YdaS (Cro superfamily)
MDTKTVKRVFEKAGGAAELARKLGISRAAVAQWKQVPIQRVAEVERITGVSRYRLRPDIFGSKDKAS